MNTRTIRRCAGAAAAPALLVALLFWAGLPSRAGAAPVGSSFTYQGSLNDGGSPATGAYDFQFSLFDAASAGTNLAGTLTLDDVAVTSGVFSVDLDFGSASFSGEARWLELQVRPGASTGLYTTLPRQQLRPTPFALGLSLPCSQVLNSALITFRIENTGSGGGAEFVAGGTGLNYGVVGRNTGTGFNSAGVRGIADAASGNVVGVEGRAVNSPIGTGLLGVGSATGAYITGTGAGSTGVYAYGDGLGLRAENTGTATAVYAVGKGQTASNATLRVHNTNAVQGMAAFLTNSSDYATAHFRNQGTGQVLWLENTGGGNFISATNGGDLEFWVDNTGVTHTKVLEILGGADLSERFDIQGEDALEPGTVVSIDPAHEGLLLASTQPYDRRVAGILSGAGGVKTGMLMGQRGSAADGAHAVALTGRVYCLATTENGPITPGDLLTTSSVPGHAMRADDPARSHGAILGKAMGSLASGRGLVLVLVGLQ
ncbi:MAG: hypothetical protein HZB25_02995 [Candidatus Eisenbacteria bacterium]|nr:hypothetical protein [Candidatus Eisenbacteria bacterium]